MPVIKISNIKYQISNKYQASSALRAGFTLIELIVVIAILGVLGASAFRLLDPFAQINKAQDIVRQQDLSNIKTALDTYYSDTNCYPTDDVFKFGEEFKAGQTIYMKKVPQDPSCLPNAGSCYVYSVDDESSDCPQWGVIYAKLAKPNPTRLTCPLEVGSCAPDNFTSEDSNAIACALLGSVDCAYIAFKPIIFPVGSVPNPTFTPTPTLTPTPTPTPTPQPPVEFVASADTYVGAEFPGTNFGTFTNLDVMSSGTSPRRAFLRFDLSSIPGGSTIQTARLYVYMYESSGSRTYNVNQVTGSWTENSITWSNQPGIGSEFNSLNIPSTPGSFYFGVSSFVQNWVNGQPNNGVRIADAVENSASPFVSRFRSKEWDDSSQRPRLEISYAAGSSASTPTPSPTPTPTSSPTPTPSPTPSSTPGLAYKRVFITSGTYSGDLKTLGSDVGLGSAISGIDGANKICQSRANNPDNNSSTNDALGGTWKAWISDATANPVNQSDGDVWTQFNGEYRLIDGVTKIVDSWNALINTSSIDILANPISKNERGQTQVAYYVWTDTTRNGTLYNTDRSCNNWTSGSSSLRTYVGLSDQRTSGWTLSNDDRCNLSWRLYCFEQ